MNKTKLYLVVVLISSIFMGYFICTNYCTEADCDAFVVGMAAGYAPFVSINAEGEYEGFDIDVAHALADRMCKKLILKDLGSMPSLLIALQQGSIDAIIWGMSITKERLKKFSMVHYQGNPQTVQPVLFWEKIPDGIQSLADLNNMTVCVEPSSSQSALVERYKNITVLPVERVDDALLHLRYGRAVAAVVEPAVAKKFQARCPEIKVIEHSLLPEDHVMGTGIMMNRENTELVSLVQKEVDALKAIGFFNECERKWGIA